jgi:hypothetical protein
VTVHSLVRHHWAAGVAVYNIEVEGDHTYFVGNNGEWVHNLCNAAIDEAASDIERIIANMKGSRSTKSIFDRITGKQIGEVTNDGGSKLVIRYPHVDRGTPVLHWNVEDYGAGINWHMRIIP